MTQQTSSEDNAYLLDPNNSALSKREYFAASALQGILSNPELLARSGNGDAARMAVSFADKLIAQLNEPVGLPKNLPFPM